MNIELATEVHSTNPEGLIAKVYLDWHPQPGQHLELEGHTYTILERRHRYHLRRGKYNLYKAILCVQLLEQQEKQLWEGRWVIGNPDCRFNARSAILRCAVNPSGPCLGCASFESQARPVLGEP